MRSTAALRWVVVFDPAAPEPEIPIPASHLLALLGAIRRQYRLSWLGIHGVGHWARVLDTGLRLAIGRARRNYRPRFARDGWLVLERHRGGRD